MMVPLRVSNGMQWLDAVRPGWFDRIDLQRFDMTSTTDCVYGQVFGSLDSYGAQTKWLQQSGFDAVGQEIFELEAEWLRMIKERRCAQS